MRIILKIVVVAGALTGTAKGLYFTETRIDTVSTSWGFVVMSFWSVGDIDGDGDKDIYCNAWAESPNMRWYRNDLGSFAKQTIAGSGIYGHALRDFAGDYLPDIVSLDFSYQVFLHQNIGGSFPSYTTIDAAGSAPNHCDAADADGDGDIDIVVSHSPAGFYAYRNNGGGSFTKITVYSYGANGENEGVCWADIDGDRDQDVVGCHWGSGWVMWFRNDGWSFSVGGTVASGLPYPHGVHSADFDGDGDQDILVVLGSAGSGAGDARIYLNNGAGAFTERYVGPVTYGCAGMFSDLDKDGDMDVVAAGASGGSWPASGEIAWFENTGSGFVKRNLTTGNSYGVWVGDIDGNGCPDILGNNYTGGYSYLSIFFGQDCALGADESTKETSNSMRISGSIALIRLIGPGKLAVFDPIGRKLREWSLERGEHRLIWDEGLGRGAYLLVLDSGERLSSVAVK
ncbi:MAG: VCBS repeat-containing protein [candidate division WOR-3 bacterium]